MSETFRLTEGEFTRFSVTDSSVTAYVRSLPKKSVHGAPKEFFTSINLLLQNKNDLCKNIKGIY